MPHPKYPSHDADQGPNRWVLPTNPKATLDGGGEPEVGSTPNRPYVF